MNKIFAAVIALTAAMAATPGKSEERHMLTPAEAAARYFEAIASNQLDAAAALVAMPEGRTEGEVRKFNTRLAEHFQKHAKIMVIAHLALEDVAVVVCSQYDARLGEKADIDPMYCVRNDGKWFVTFEGQPSDSAEDWSGEGQAARLEKVAAWYESQSGSLHDLFPD